MFQTQKKECNHKKTFLECKFRKMQTILNRQALESMLKEGAPPPPELEFIVPMNGMAERGFIFIQRPSGKRRLGKVDRYFV